LNQGFSRVLGIAHFDDPGRAKTAENAVANR